MQIRVLATVFLLVLLAACGSGRGSGPADVPGSQPAEAGGAADDETGETSSPGTASDPAAARRALHEAVRTMRADEATGFRAQLLVAGDTWTETTGVNVASGWESSSTFRKPDEAGSNRMLVRSTDGTVWMQLPGWPPYARGCWLQMGPGQVPVGVLAMTPDQPVYYRALGALEASGFADSAGTTLSGTLRADAALNLLPGQLVAELELAGLREDDRVPVEIGYDGSRIVSVSVAGGDLLRMVEEAGGSASGPVRGMLGSVETTVEYSLPDEVPTVSPPAADLVMTAEDMTPDGGGCH